MAEFSLVHLHQPARQGDAPHPALVFLHGLGDDERGMFSLAGSLDSRFTVISARAPQRHLGGGYAWYDLDRDGPALGGEGIESALALMSRFLDEVVPAYSLDPRRIYLGGFSLGAAMAGAFALLNPDRVAGALMISGFLPPDADNRYDTHMRRRTPIFQGHGTEDQVVPLEYAHLTRDILLAAGVELTYREYRVAHSISVGVLGDVDTWLRERLDLAQVTL